MSVSAAVENSPLGQSTPYTNRYDPGLLYPIPRSGSRQDFYGVDIWNAYEVSWLNARGKPQVRLAEFRVPADSANIIESKSFKLYLNSFNLTRFDDQQTVVQQLEQDLSAAAGASVAVKLHAVDVGLQPQPLNGECLDELDIDIQHYLPEPALLSADPKQLVSETLVSHLLKSNCPVTGQPDWASIQISYRGPQMDRAGLLAYLVSYREKGDFHEACVEQIHRDLMQRCHPDYLSVYARYVRRGGLDINPFRCSEPVEVNNCRLLRQ
ncbi:NADPH-dependent 7-cyano-7-deazaguanine reductase QueF [Marinospirillum alkaliphilum]|uniref:NADPH-dependent 7-cyano-7-deazaguanine reductase n=1 Tax=Marinospirillum alkaliphilum DSM 21637 TaxID=1122209 RepID=A0A1K1YMI4_9GAMM|nr:NADPH-dependent 7-cyano-7-deazaguanine reductase QueF [Marinospirillum alkaliphilum]SFX63193.1 7-cyano-7-deazaguanine reductase [Marinospirillum alkaliphilum DSM 21637]